MGKKRFSKVSVVSLVPDLILSINCGHVLFMFLVVFFVFCFCFFVLNPKTLKIFKKTKIFYFVSSFSFFYKKKLKKQNNQKQKQKQNMSTIN